MVVNTGKCITCGKDFKKYREPGQKSFFCSNECRKKPSNRGKSFCESCGNEFEWYRASTQNKPRVCSSNCRGKLVKTWRSKSNRSWKHSSEQEKEKMLRDALEERLIKKEGCWEWNGFHNKDGYPMLSAGKLYKASRLVYRFYRKTIPEGFVVRHIVCANAKCLNPHHMEIGTLQDNSNDRVKDGNSQKGSKNCKSKLNEMQVKEIKNMLIQGLSGASIARKFNVSRSVICSIKKGRTWQHV